MDRLSEQDVKDALSPFHPRISAIINRAYAEWLSMAECRVKNGYAPLLYPRTVTNNIFDAIAREAMAEFNDDPNVRVVPESQTVKFCFSNEVIARFKKADECNLGQNIPTQAALDFADAQQTLPGFPPEAVKVEFTWAANDIGTEIDRITVLARDHNSVLWSYEIIDE